LLRVGAILAKRFPAKKRMASALGESHRGSPRHGARNSLFGRNNSLFREQQGIACKLLKSLQDSPLAQTTGNSLQAIEIAG
jgi:hypothetical protein